MKLRTFFYVLLTLGLAACQTTQPSLTSYVGPLNIVDFTVTSSTTLPPESRIVEAVTYYAKQRMATHGTTSGRAYQVSVQITELHYKSAVTSLLVGDANRLAAVLSITDETGKLIMQRNQSASSNVLINGILGAVTAASSNKQGVDQQLAQDLASQVDQALFGGSR